MNENIKVLGGICVFLFIPILIVGIWVNHPIVWKILLTDALLIILLGFIDRD